MYHDFRLCVSLSRSIFISLLSVAFSSFSRIHRSGSRCSTQFMHIESWFYFHCFAAGFCFIATKVTRLTEKRQQHRSIFDMCERRETSSSLLLVYSLFFREVMIHDLGFGRKRSKENEVYNSC